MTQSAPSYSAKHVMGRTQDRQSEIKSNLMMLPEKDKAAQLIMQREAKAKPDAVSTHSCQPELKAAHVTCFTGSSVLKGECNYSPRDVREYEQL